MDQMELKLNSEVVTGDGIIRGVCVKARIWVGCFGYCMVGAQSVLRLGCVIYYYCGLAAGGVYSLIGQRERQNWLKLGRFA